MAISGSRKGIEAGVRASPMCLLLAMAQETVK